MFIIEPIKKEEATGELKLLYKMIEKSLGFVPPHFELFATIDLKAMKEFVGYNQYMMMHEKIDSNLLPYLRLYIANTECRSYCTSFNTKMLLSIGADESLLNNITNEINNIPFNDAQKLLLSKVLKALYQPNEFNKDDLAELYALEFNDKDFFDLLSYASNFMSKSKIIEVYLKNKKED